MARIRSGELSASEVAAASGVGTRMLRAMWECQLLPTRGYTAIDVVVARMARYVWYAGGARALVSDPLARRAAEDRAVRAGRMLREAEAAGELSAATRLVVVPAAVDGDLTLVAETWKLMATLDRPEDSLNLAVGAWLAAAKSRAAEVAA